MRNILYTMLLLLGSSEAIAVTDYDKTIHAIGIGLNPNPLLSGSFRTAEKLAIDCPYETIYFDVSSNSGKAMYSTILMAKAGKYKLSRIDYFLTADGRYCSLNYVEVTDQRITD